MSIRIRTVDGVRVALCAARSMPKECDVYLDDADHFALAVKFEVDHQELHGYATIHAGSEETRLMEREESNNPNRAWWDRAYAPNAL